MISTDTSSLRALNSLLPICNASQQGYETAAADASDAEIGRFFGELAAQRMKFGDELRARVRTLRAEPGGDESGLAAAHRGWIDFEAAVAHAPVHALLVECERAEDVAVAAYADALKTTDLDKQTRTIIQRQYEAVQLGHDRVRQLRDRAESAHR
ncbi:MAG TPA: PA2169 family four-helix-bundle protein [Opitutaceae bacterium]|nr:PA2169 family four-helix-bundle protein [Opitutaceae bacterium]